MTDTVTASILRRAAKHAPTALPTQLGDWCARQLTATADTLEGPFAEHTAPTLVADMTAMSWELLSLPARPGPEDDRVVAAAKAMWTFEFPPNRDHMTWEEINHRNPSFVARYLQLAAAALTAEDLEHRRLYDMAKGWRDVWEKVDQDRPEDPHPVIVESLAQWLVDHDLGRVEEPDEDDSSQVYTGIEVMRELAALLLTYGPGMRAAANAEGTDS